MSGRDRIVAHFRDNMDESSRTDWVTAGAIAKR